MSLHDLYERLCHEGSDIQAHLPTLRDAVVSHQAHEVIEIGVRTGVSTAALLDGVTVTGGHLWSCDIERPTVPVEIWDCPAWTFCQGDSREVADQAPNMVEVLFIDSAHSYEVTQRELELYVPRVRPGGVVLLHDVAGHAPGVNRALDEYGPWRTLTTECWGLGCIDVGS